MKTSASRKRILIVPLLVIVSLVAPVASLDALSQVSQPGSSWNRGGSFDRDNDDNYDRNDGPRSWQQARPPDRFDGPPPPPPHRVPFNQGRFNQGRWDDDPPPPRYRRRVVPRFNINIGF
jgi:hypothetical protein